MADAFLRAVELRPDPEGRPRSGYPWTLPAVAPLAAGVRLHPAVTYLIGENGSGKSTLLEAIAVASGMNPEGGSSSLPSTPAPVTPNGGRSLHEQSHGESFLAVMINRFAPDGCTCSTNPKRRFRPRTA